LVEEVSKVAGEGERTPMGRQKNTEKSSAWARLLHAHTDEELTADLDAIIDHPFVIQRKDDADGPDLLWTLKQRCHDADGLKRIMSSALASPATPPDLYRMIVDFLGTHMALPGNDPQNGSASGMAKGLQRSR
jgi:hypothetical protein